MSLLTFSIPELTRAIRRKVSRFRRELSPLDKELIFYLKRRSQPIRMFFDF
jgi:hypothetical protein